MNTSDRIKRIREVERAAQRLTASGWTLEAIEYTDEADQPFRTTVRLATDSGDADNSRHLI